MSGSTTDSSCIRCTHRSAEKRTLPAHGNDSVFLAGGGLSNPGIAIDRGFRLPTCREKTPFFCGLIRL